MLATQAKRSSRMMTGATFLLDSAKVGEVFKSESPFFQLTEGAELPASWQVGDAALPTSLEERKAFLGLDDLLMDKKSSNHMGEPKVK